MHVHQQGVQCCIMQLMHKVHEALFCPVALFDLDFLEVDYDALIVITYAVVICRLFCYRFFFSFFQVINMQCGTLIPVLTFVMLKTDTSVACLIVGDWSWSFCIVAFFFFPVITQLNY